MWIVTKSLLIKWGLVLLFLVGLIVAWEVWGK